MDRRRWIGGSAFGAAMVAAALVMPAASLGAAHCDEPGPDDWETATPAAAGMDAAELEAAIAYATENQAAAVRVYRYGCRVGEDSLAAANRQTTFQSWSLSKSVTSMVFGRAMTRSLVGPDDPLGSLLPVADAAHGAITMRELLTMTSGLRWNGLRDYNISMPNRIQEGLTVPVEKPPGSYWEYSQSGPALVAEATQAAVGEDFQAYAQRELFAPLGIEPGSWSWERDSAGHTQAFFGLHMTPDDFARLGELMRRDGRWNGRRLLSRRYLRESVAPIAQNGCYGWFIWVNASKPCVGPRVVDRPVSDNRSFPTLPADAYQFAGLFGQLVNVFPSQGLVIARFGVDTGTVAGGADWEEEFYGRVLGSIVDEPVDFPAPKPDAQAVDRTDVDRGFFDALQQPADVLAGESPPPLPPAGPARARAALIKLRAQRPGPRGAVKARVRCPRAWPGPLKPRCSGTARLTGAKGTVRYRARAGKGTTIRFRMQPGFLRRLAGHPREVTIAVRNRDRAGGTVARRTFVLRPR